MKIRLMGTEDDCAAAVAALVASGKFDVLDVSRLYTNRGDNSPIRRMYIEAELIEDGQ